MKILLVEDSAVLRYTTVSFIERAGHQALVAESGEQALQLIETVAVDLVIMDVEMPGLDGFETTRLIREFFGEHWVPIIFVTGMSDEASYQKGIEAGGDDYMIKPVSPVILQAKLRAFERIADMQHQFRELNEKLQCLSQRDSLTELYNRRAFEEKAHSQWQVSTRAHEPVTILMIDVDHFKEFNDHYGHQAGDECLKLVANTLLSNLHRPADLIARYGGEEFIALLPSTNLQGARTVAETLRHAVQSLGIPHARSSTGPVVTVSIGGAVAEHITGIDEKSLAREADNALYRAKAQGRNRSSVVQIAPHKTVLIVSEVSESAQGASSALSGRFNVITAGSIDECLEIAHNCHPDLIISIGAPGEAEMKGVQKNLQGSERTAGIPIMSIAETTAGKSDLLRKVEARLG